MRRRGSLALLLPLGLAVILFAPVLFADRHLYFRDVLTFSFPEKLFTAEALRRGSLPLWDPRLGGGVPHLAYVTYGVLDPLNLLLLVAPLPRALDLLIATHVLLASALAFGLARRLGLSPAAAALAASSFALGGTMQGLTCNLPYLASAAYLPGALWALEALLETPRSTRRIAVLAVSLALTFLAGDPEVVYLLAALLPLRLLLAGRPGTGGRALAALAAGALALGLVAIVLLPGLELLDRSERARGVALAEAELWSLHPARLVELAVPLPWGAVVPDVAWWGSFLENYPTGEPWVLTLYAGIAVVLLAPLGLVALARSRAGRRDRRAGLVLLAVAAALGLALALGTHLALHALAHDLLPGFARFRYPAKLFLWTALALPLLAGSGLDWLLARTPRRIAAAAGGVLVLVLALLLLALSVRFPTSDHVAGFAARAGARLDYTSPDAAAANLRRRAGHALGATSAMAAALVVLRRRPAAAAAAIALLGAVDVALVARDQLATTGPALFRLRTPVVAALERLVPDRTAQRVLVVPEYGRFARPVGPDEILQPLTRLERIRFEDVVNLSPNLALVHGFRIHGGYLSARPAQEKTWWEAVWASRDPVLVERALRLTATAAVVAAPVAAAGLAQLPGLETRPTPAGFAPGAGILAVRSPLPRAHVAGRAIGVGSAGEALAVIARDEFEPGRDVALEGAGEGATDPPGSIAATGVARVVRDDGARVEVAARVEGGRGWLVLADSYDRGWRARVDGHPAPVLRANGMQRAVALPAGEHVVVFDYAPASFRRGRALSIAALFACGVLAIRGGRRGSSLPDDRAPRRGYGP